MSIEERTQQFVRIARSIPTNDAVPLAFEQRIMARLADPMPLELFELWTRLLWKLAAGGIAIAFLAAIWAASAPKQSPLIPDLANDLEKTILAPFGSMSRPW